MIDLVSPWHFHIFIPSIDIFFTRLFLYDLCWLFRKDWNIYLNTRVSMHVKKIEIYHFHFYAIMTSNQAITEMKFQWIYNLHFWKLLLMIEQRLWRSELCIWRFQVKRMWVRKMPDHSINNYDVQTWKWSKNSGKITRSKRQHIVWKHFKLFEKDIDERTSKIPFYEIEIRGWNISLYLISTLRK